MSVDAARSELKQRLDESIVLRAEQVSKVYPGTVALKRVDFNVYRGKVNVLIGENGAGKSSLMKILAGAEEPSEGRLILEGEEVHFRSPGEAAERGISIVYQELNLFPNLSIADNIFMAREIRTRLGTIDRSEQERITRKLLARLDFPIDPRTEVGQLRIGEQQLIEIAKSLALNVKILILDEPTSSLSSTETEVLFKIVRQLTADGVAVIYISHRLDECIRIGDHFTVLRDGNLVAEAPADQVSLAWIVQHMSGRRVDSLFQRGDVQAGDEVLKVSDLRLPSPTRGMLVDGVNFSLRAGEIVGIYGLVGAGRTELLECLMGLRPECTGSILLDGVELMGKRIDERIQLGMTLIPEDRQLRGLVPILSVGHNITCASIRRFFRRFVLSAAEEAKAIRQMISQLSIKVSNPDQPVFSLSGGNQQKVVVAKNLLTSPKVLLMDEPTRGIDIGAKDEIFRICDELASQGIAILMVSSELKEVVAMADRVLVMSEGRITLECRRGEYTEEDLVEASVAGRIHKGEIARASAPPA